MHAPKCLLFAAALLCGFAASAPRAADAPPDRLHVLFEEEWERGLRENPTRATYLGDHRFDREWPDLSAEMLARRHAADLQVLADLRDIPDSALGESDRLDSSVNFTIVHFAEMLGLDDADQLVLCLGVTSQPADVFRRPLHARIVVPAVEEHRQCSRPVFLRNV